MFTCEMYTVSSQINNICTNEVGVCSIMVATIFVGRNLDRKKRVKFKKTLMSMLYFKD